MPVAERGVRLNAALGEEAVTSPIQRGTLQLHSYSLARAATLVADKYPPNPDSLIPNRRHSRRPHDVPQP